jgi:hypothetical protein
VLQFNDTKNNPWQVIWLGRAAAAPAAGVCRDPPGGPAAA